MICELLANAKFSIFRELTAEIWSENAGFSRFFGFPNAKNRKIPPRFFRRSEKSLDPLFIGLSWRLGDL